MNNQHLRQKCQAGRKTEPREVAAGVDNSPEAVDVFKVGGISTMTVKQAMTIGGETITTEEDEEGEEEIFDNLIY